MLDPFASWSRMMSSAFDLARAGQKVLETMTASHDVVNTRTGLIGDAIKAPLTADYAELGRMVPEKVEAFSQAGSTIVTEWWALQVALMSESQHLAAMAMRGRPPTVGELTALATRSQAHLLRSLERSVAMSTKAIAPIHAKATSNARRLKRRGKG